MKRFPLIPVLVLLLFLSGCSFPVVEDPEVTYAEELPPDLSNTALQQRLIDLGWLHGAADGILGPASRNAISAFQEACGLEPTGEADEETLAILFGEEHAIPTPSPTPLAKGARDEEGQYDVKRLQARLIRLKYLSGEADGIFGSATRDALRCFQEWSGLDPTGEADETTKAALYAPDAMPKPTPEPTPRIKGAKGDEILQMQEALKCMGFLEGDADGDLGSLTLEAADRYLAWRDEHPLPTPTPSPTPVPTPSPTPPPSPSPTPEATPELTLRPITEAPEDISLHTAQITRITGEKESTPDTEETQAKAQEEAGTAEGISDELLAEILSMPYGAPEETLEKGSSGRETERMQRRLYNLRYLNFTTDIDGDFGGRTLSALNFFFRRNGLPETGIADRDALALLYSADAVDSGRPDSVYKLLVSIRDQRVYAYEWREGSYSKLLRTMICSTGTNTDPTPTGTYSAGGPSRKWYYFKEHDCWAQYGYVIKGGIMFHSVLYDKNDESTLRRGSVSALGRKASHGCVRLKVEDAKWIWEHCPRHTTVVIE